MTKSISSDLSQAASTTTSKSIKNTFAPNCGNKYFEPTELFGLCRYGFPYKDLPDEAKKMLDGFLACYDKKAQVWRRFQILIARASTGQRHKISVAKMFWPLLAPYTSIIGFSNCRKSNSDWGIDAVAWCTSRADSELELEHAVLNL